jgi:flagellar basal body-associated protein FliL
MKKISKLAISIPSTVIAVTGVTAGITSCGKDEPQSKTDIKNVLTNTVVIDENVTNNVNSLNGNQILNLLGGRNPNLKTEHLKFSLNTPPYRDETMTNDINF